MTFRSLLVLKSHTHFHDLPNDMAIDLPARAISNALSAVKQDDLLVATKALEERWTAELEAANTRARASHGDVLRERQSLQNALGTAADIWDTLQHVELPNNKCYNDAATLRNATLTLQCLDFFERVPEALDDAHNELTRVIADGAREAVPGNAASLYDIHAVLSAVERLHDIAAIERDSEVPPVMARAGQIRSELDLFLMTSTFGDILTVAKCNPRFLVASMRVVIAEERRDEWLKRYVAANRMRHSGKTLPQRPDYRQRFYRAVATSVDDAFRDMDGELAAQAMTSEITSKVKVTASDVHKVLAWLDERVQDGEQVERFVAPCVPAKFNIVQFYQRTLHVRLMRTMTTLLRLTTQLRNGEQDAVLRILQWYSAYKVGDRVQLVGVDEYLDAEDRERLVAFVRRHVSQTVGEQIGNVVDASKILRVADDVSTSQTLPVELVSSMDELVKYASTLGIPAIRKAVAIGVADSLQSLHSRYATALAINDEKRRPRYVCAVANNMAHLLEYAESLRENLAAALDETDRLEVIAALEANIEKFRDLAKSAVHCLSGGVESSLAYLTARLFAPHTGTEVMLDIIGMLDDSLLGYKPHLMKDHFDQLTLECLRALVGHYVSPFLALAHSDGSRLVASRSDYTGMQNSFRAVVRKSLDRGEMRSRFPERIPLGGSGLLTMSATAVVAQIIKDEENLSKLFVSKSAEPYQKRQMQIALEPLGKLRNLYLCQPTPTELVRAFREAKTAFASAGKVLTTRAAEAIWGSRIDISEPVKEEAVMYAHMGGGVEQSTPQKEIRKTLSISSRFSDATADAWSMSKSSRMR